MAVDIAEDGKKEFRKQRLLVHLGDQIIDLIFSVTRIATILEGFLLLLKEPIWPLQLERGQEAGYLLEMGPDRGNLVDYVFNAYYTNIPKSLC